MVLSHGWMLCKAFCRLWFTLEDDSKKHLGPWLEVLAGDCDKDFQHDRVQQLRERLLTFDVIELPQKCACLYMSNDCCVFGVADRARLIADSCHTLYEQQAEDVLKVFFPEAFEQQSSLDRLGVNWDGGDQLE